MEREEEKVGFRRNKTLTIRWDRELVSVIKYAMRVFKTRKMATAARQALKDWYFMRKRGTLKGAGEVLREVKLLITAVEELRREVVMLREAIEEHLREHEKVRVGAKGEGGGGKDIWAVIEERVKEGKR